MNSLSAKIYCLLLFISSIIISCNDDKIVYPEGGYKYPSHVEDKDTTFYCYPLKDIQSTRDSFESAYYFFKIFDEPNLSLKPRDEVVFRLICGSNPSSIIILTSKQIIIKKQTKG